MKIVVDAMAADFGGIRTYVEHLLAHWPAAFPDDELHVVVARGSTADTSVHTRHELAVRRPRSLGRPWAQTTTMRRLIVDLAPDVVIATSPSTGVRRLPCSLAVVIHDLRHEVRPEQFTWARRMLRRVSYGRSYALAHGFVSVSQRSLDDLHALRPATRDKPAGVAYHGADHVLAWPRGARRGSCISFTHHTNKNPRLVLDAWYELMNRGGEVPHLLMLGVPAMDRRGLEQMVEERGLGAHVALAPYLPDADFQSVVASAEMIVFPSDFEGFGLPVVEGMNLGVPVVIGPEKATLEIANGHAVVMADWSPQALADAIVSAGCRSEEDTADARAWAGTFTWHRAVRETRLLLAVLSGDSDE